jgi:hypothetical protein
LLSITQRVHGGRRSRGARGRIDKGDGAVFCIGRILDIGRAGDESLRILLCAVFLLVLGLLLLAVQLALVLLVLRDARLAALAMRRRVYSAGEVDERNCTVV